jgi:hypothetical protein
VAAWDDYLASMFGTGQGGGILGATSPGTMPPAMKGGAPIQFDPSATQTPSLTAPAAQADPSASRSDNFWNARNPDGTSSYLGGLFTYDPRKDIGANDRLGLFGASLADASANLGGHPEAATNIARYTKDYRQQGAGQALAGLFGGSSNIGQPLALPPAQPGGRFGDTQSSPSTSWNAGNPGPTGGPIPIPPGSDHPHAPPSQGTQFNMRSMLPRLMQIQAQFPDADIAPYITALKDMQPKFSQTPQRDASGRMYVLDDTGNAKYLDGITAPPKITVAPNGVAYDENNTAPGTDFSDKGKPFSSATGAANVPVQNFDIRKATAGAQMRLDAAQNVDPNAVQVGVDYAMANGGKLPPTARNPVLQQAILAGVGNRLQTSGQTYDDLVRKGQDIHASGATLTAFDKGKQGDNVRSLNVAVAHLSTLGKLADALGNGDVQGFNKVGQYISQQTGNAAPTNFDTAKNLVGDEITKAVIGSGGTGADREKAQGVISRANSPQQLKGAIQTYLQLLGGQIQGLRQQYETGTGRKDFGSRLSPETKAALGWRDAAPVSAQNLPRLNAPAGMSGGVKWRIVAPGGQ